MTAKEAVNWITNIMADIGKSEHSDLWHYEQALTEIREMLEADAQQWIPCSERLPEGSMWTICQNNAGAMMIGKYDIEFGWMFPAYFDGIVAWKPLPESWKG